MVRAGMSLDQVELRVVGRGDDAIRHVHIWPAKNLRQLAIRIDTIDRVDVALLGILASRAGGKVHAALSVEADVVRHCQRKAVVALREHFDLSGLHVRARHARRAAFAREQVTVRSEVEPIRFVTLSDRRLRPAD